MDATFLNGVANNPAVRPMLGGVGELELSSYLADPNNVALQGAFGGFIAVKLEAGVYECHSMFLPEGRGKHAYEAMTEGLRYLFVQTDCIEVVTKCPKGNMAALGAARNMGFTLRFTLEQGWALPDGLRGAVDCMGLTFAKWLTRDAEVEAKGKWFHQRLEELAAIPEHFEEPSHNRAVGASCLMFDAGNPVKAQASYNLWAKFAGFPQIRLLSLNPVIIDMDQVIVSIGKDDMEILQCR